jgi:hypothetical protein
VVIGSSEFANKMPGMTKEMRDGVVAAFDALAKWRDEIEAVNERCLKKVLEQTSTVARSMGWPDQAVRMTKEHLEKASKAQTEIIDQIMEGWKQQVTAPGAMGVPRSFSGQMPGAMPAFDPMAPWTFWMQAAEAWQRTWMPDAARQKDRFRSH